jgi:hypothetical protein
VSHPDPASLLPVARSLHLPLLGLVVLAEDARPPEGLLSQQEVPALDPEPFAHGASARSRTLADEIANDEPSNPGRQITNIKKEFQSDEGLRQLMMRLQGGNEKLASSIQNVSIGRDLKDYPGLIEDYNDTIKAFEEVLVKYLKGGKEAKKRPRIRRGGFMGMGGTKVDAIEYYGFVDASLPEKTNFDSDRSLPLLLQNKARSAARDPRRQEGGHRPAQAAGQEGQPAVLEQRGQGREAEGRARP